jgi:hypothetical protein
MLKTREVHISDVERELSKIRQVVATLHGEGTDHERRERAEQVAERLKQLKETVDCIPNR